MRPHRSNRSALRGLALAATTALLLAGCGDADDAAMAQATAEATPDAPPDPSTDTDAAPAEDETSWTATSTTPEEETFADEGPQAGSYRIGDMGPDIATLQLQEGITAVAILHFPAALVEDGGTFDLSDPLGDLETNAVLLSRYAGASTGELTIEPNPDQTLSGTFTVRVSDDTGTASLAGSFQNVDPSS